MDSVVVVLKSQLLRDAASLLLRESGLRVTVATPDVASALGEMAVQRLENCDFVVVDPELLGPLSVALEKSPCGFDGARIIIFIYDRETDQVVKQDIAAADGILPWEITPGMLVRVLRLIQSGERVMPSRLLDELQSSVQRPLLATVGKVAPKQLVDEPSLSPREAEILKLLPNGDSNKAIARRLGIAEATVKVHLKALLRKLRVANRTQAAIWAMNKGHAAATLFVAAAGYLGYR